ncbi:MAG: MBL fold metallo-hydrolase, partial [Pseudomonadota bacterium]
HGPIVVPFFGFKLQRQPGPTERVGLGAMAFLMTLGNASVLNLGDSVFMEDWDGLKPTVLMLPIGGLGQDVWTMDTKEALEAVRRIDPEIVIPCHYSVPFLWKKKFAQADVGAFRKNVEALGKTCWVLGSGDSRSL